MHDVGWDRSAFCTSPEEVELHEAALALRRLLASVPLSREGRRAVEAALAVIEARTR